jgi:regulator of protease activity HflC (stomatin/prohibitin superfamily)
VRRYTDNNGDLNIGVVIKDFCIGLVLLICLMKFWPLRSVPTGNRGVITVGGAIKGIESEGFLLVAPWQSLSIFNVRSESATIDNAEGSTSDTQPVNVSLTVRYSILPDKVSEVFEKYSRDGDLSSYVQTATQEVFKAVTAKYTAPDLISKRALVSNEIVAALRTKLEVYGAQVINVDMRGFSFSKEYMAAINAKTTQEQLRLGAENKFKTVEAEQKQKVAIAEAEANAKKAEADGIAYSNLKIATAQADALKIQGNALAQNPTVLELRRVEVEMEKAQKWNGALPTSIYAGTPIPFFSPKQ